MGNDQASTNKTPRERLIKWMQQSKLFSDDQVEFVLQRFTEKNAEVALQYQDLTDLDGVHIR